MKRQIKENKKWLHVEINDGGLFIYQDSRKRRATEITYENWSNECCMMNGESSYYNHILKPGICVFTQGGHFVIDITKLKIDPK